LEEEADRAADRAVAGQPVGSLSTFFIQEDVQRKKAQKINGEPPESTLSASLTWFQFDPEEGVTFEAGDIGPQLSAMVLKNLLGSRYSAELGDKILNDLTPRLGWLHTRVAKEGEPFHGALVRPETIGRILAASVKENVPITLPADKQPYLELGLTAHKAYKVVASAFPKWFTRDLFDTVVANHTYLLTQVAQGSADATDIGRAIGVAVNAVEAIRTDAALAGHAGYGYLWHRDEGQSATTVPEDAVPSLGPAAALITYAEARPKTTTLAEVPAGAAARKSLLDGFVASFDLKQLQPTKKGDQTLSSVPSTYTAPPYPSTLTVYPPLDGGLYGSTRAEYGFQMALEFPNVFAGFQFHHYDFKAFRVPDNQLESAAEAMKGPGRSSSHWDLLKGSLVRDQRYQDADVRAYADSIWAHLGPPGVSVDPVRINAALRYLGTIVGSAVEAFADPSYVARFRFDDEGLYIVRCVATWDAGGAEISLKRPPSVDWVILYARSPELLAEAHLQAVSGEQTKAKKRIDEIDRTKSDPNDPKGTAERAEERKRLVAAVGGVEGLLSYQRDELAKSSDQSAHNRVTEINKIIDTRHAKGFDKDTERLLATFVNDAGQVIDLLIEVRETNRRGPDDADYEVNDATTPSSVSDTGTGKRQDAITDALRKIFKNSDYGRGRATVFLPLFKGARDGTYVAVPIDTVSSGKMFMEALSNTATILSVVALALATMTGGESLVLMTPAMVIGAVPSAYNIVKRGLNETLHPDLALAMDIVNVVGAAIGVGAETRVGMQAITMLGPRGGKVLVVFLGVGIMGSGVLVMGASVIDQLEAVRTMPEGLQQAEVMKILSQAMIHAGITMGSLLATQVRARGVGEGPRTFEEWLNGLDEKSRSAIEQTKVEKDPAANLWRIWADMDPVVRDLLTQCGSECTPDKPPSKPDQARLKLLAQGLNEQGHRTLQGLLHDNRALADFRKLLADLESARSRAPRSLGGKEKSAAVQAEILKQGTVANDLLAKLSEEAVNERAGPADPKRWERTVKLAEEVGTAQKIPLDVLRRVIDHVKTIQGANPEEVLLFLKRLGDLYGKVPGIDTLLGSKGLTGGYRVFEGARWTFQFLEENGLWGAVKAFEDPAPVLGIMDRTVDVRLVDDTRIELKSWEKWHEWAPASFSQQIMADYLGTNGFTAEAVKWVFESGGSGGVQSAAALIENMTAALDQALSEKWPHYDDAGAAARVARIKANLPNIVRVGKL
jgi:hypothetical protein